MNEANKSTSRLDSLIGSNYRISAFRDLPVTHQLAIAHYMAIDGCAWEALFDDVAESNIGGLISALPDYVREYGDCQWSFLDIPTSVIKVSILSDEEIAPAFSGWTDYATWYLGRGDTPEHGHENRWPVILSSSNDETLQDGWHRLHSYIRAGHTDIPCVFYPELRHKKAAY